LYQKKQKIAGASPLGCEIHEIQVHFEEINIFSTCSTHNSTELNRKQRYVLSQVA
jgi:hypothetical protein